MQLREAAIKNGSLYTGTKKSPLFFNGSKENISKSCEKSQVKRPISYRWADIT